jgi:hypothetical protein
MILRWIDNIPLPLLIVIALLMAIMPLNSTPHLVEKAVMLFQGALTKPVDIFDLFMHGTPAGLLLIRVIRMGIKKLK